MEITTRPHSRRWRRVRSWLACAAVVLGIGMLAPAALGFSQRSVADTAMAGTVSRGSLAFERPVSKLEQLRVGDVISFSRPDPGGTDAMVTRRVVAIEGGAVLTRGDARSAQDPWALHHDGFDGAELTRMVFAVPLVGYPQLLVPWLSWAVVALLVAGAAAAASVAARREARRPAPRAGIGPASPGALA